MTAATEAASDEDEHHRSHNFSGSVRRVLPSHAPLGAAGGLQGVRLPLPVSLGP